MDKDPQIKYKFNFFKKLVSKINVPKGQISVGESVPTFNVNIVKPPLSKRIMANPFKYYFRAGGITFGIVLATNLATSIFARNSITENMGPQGFMFCLLCKGFYFGALWPAFYITALRNPTDAFVLGGGVDRWFR
jgi:hypothetical protein